MNETPDKLRHLTIEVAKNGFVVTEMPDGPAIYVRTRPYVFETFDALATWLGSNLQMPGDAAKPSP